MAEEKNTELGKLDYSFLVDAELPFSEHASSGSPVAAPPPTPEQIARQRELQGIHDIIERQLQATHDLLSPSPHADPAASSARLHDCHNCLPLPSPDAMRRQSSPQPAQQSASRDESALEKRSRTADVPRPHSPRLAPKALITLSPIRLFLIAFALTPVLVLFMMHLYIEA
ncbi:MAG TPA: hypothetical protein V6C72_00135, partial [Chroococcales cyanobacterium]